MGETLLLGDCLEVMNQIPEDSIDMILADPPYGTTACKWDSVIDLALMWEQLKRVIKPNGAIVMFGSQPFTSALIMSNLEMFKYCWVWEKSKASNFVHANYQPLKAHEDIVVWSKGGSAQGSKLPMQYNPIHTKGKPYHKGYGHGDNRHLAGGLTERKSKELKNATGDRKPRTVIYFKTAESEGRYHPTQKPLELLSYILHTYSSAGETVLDFTMGSGSTGVACANLGRHFIGIELDKNYFEIAKQRIQAVKAGLNDIE